MEEKKKRVLVTGGAGFLGSHLCKNLLEEGCEVICLDDLSTGSVSFIQNLLSDPCFTLLKRDVIDTFDIEVEEIYNLACPASPKHYQKDPLKTIRTSAIGALKICEIAKKNGAKILQASTSEVYGDPKEHPQKESYFGNVNFFGKRSCYDEGKRIAETIFFEYRNQHGVNTKVARIFNTYGPHMHPSDGRVISNFILQALRGESITIYGDGSQTRSFCFVEDLIEGLKLLMENELFHGPVNLGNPLEVSILDLANQIIKLTKSSSEVEFCPLPEDDPKIRNPDITLAKKHLNFFPKIPLEEGLKRTISYMQEFLRTHEKVL